MPRARVASEIDTDYLRHIDWWSKVEVAETDGCWPWTKSTGSHGYGQTWDGRTVRLAHRVAWVLTHGPIPDEMTVDHACRNRRCCNPAHLRLMTNVDNAQGNGPSIRTHCRHGHEYTPDNTRTWVNAKGRVHRFCRECQRISNAKR